MIEIKHGDHWVTISDTQELNIYKSDGGILGIDVIDIASGGTTHHTEYDL